MRSGMIYTFWEDAKRATLGLLTNLFSQVALVPPPVNISGAPAQKLKSSACVENIHVFSSLLINAEVMN